MNSIVTSIFNIFFNKVDVSPINSIGTVHNNNVIHVHKKKEKEEEGNAKHRSRRCPNTNQKQKNIIIARFCHHET